MYGQNIVANKMDGSKLKVHEIFASIQGEGPFSGERAIFVRLSGCNLRCHFCDTHWDDENDPKISTSEIMGEIQRLVSENFTHGFDGSPLIIITGGEPLLQPIHSFIKELVVKKTKIQIETAGTVENPVLLGIQPKSVIVVVSPKTPIINERVERYADYFKYVISAKDEKCPDTGIPITSTQVGIDRKARLALPPTWMRPEEVYLMPQEGPGEDLQANMQEIYRLCMKHGYKGSARLHTMMGVR